MNKQSGTSRNRLLRDEGQLKTHYKMYKAGKKWLYAGISMLTFGAAVLTADISASADQTTSADTTTSETSSSQSLANQSSVVIGTDGDSSVSSNDDSVASSSSDTRDTTASSDATSADSTITSDAQTTTDASSDAASSTAASSSDTASSDATESSHSDQTSKATSDNEDTKAKTSDTTATTKATDPQADSATTTTDAQAVYDADGSLSDAAKALIAAQDPSLVATTDTTDAITGTTGDASTTASIADVSDQVANALSQLPEGTLFKTLSDGTVEFDLPTGLTSTELEAAKSALANSGLKGIQVTSAAAAATGGWRTYSGANTSVDTSNLGTVVATPITMADFALMTAAGTGAYTDVNGKTVTDASIANLQDYYNQLVDKYGKGNVRLSLALNNQSDADFAGLMDYLSEIYYYFDGSSDSYINQLVDNLDNMTTADQVAMTEFGDGADTSVGDVFQKTANVFSTQFMMVASGNGAASVGFENTQMATYSMPSGMNTQFWSGIYSEFINNIVSTYISEIVPGAESYVLEKILPAVNTASDTQGMQDTSSTGILNNIDENSNELVHALMTIDGAYSLSTIVTHIESMYENLGDSLGSLLSAMMSLVGINSNDTLGEYVGATEPGTTTGWNDTTLSGNAVAFPNFSMFNQIYLAYSKAIVSAAYGYAMVGKYDAIQTMYSESASDPDAVWTALGITDSTTPSQIDVSKFNVSIPASDTVMTETFQQGVWDVYHYIKPFYDQGVADALDGSTITSTTTLDDPTYLNEVWNEVGGNNLTDANGDKLTTTYTGTDTTDTNPHDVANYVSPQTQAYLVSFYAGVVSSNELAYSEQPAIETIVKDASGSVVKTNYTAIGSVITTTSTGAALTGSFGDAIDTSNLPTTINGYTKPTDASSITIPESGGLVYVPYSVVTVNAGQVTVKSVGAPSSATFDYTVTNSNDQVVNGATGVSYGAGVEVDLTDGDTLNVTPATVDGYVDSVSPASSVSYDDTVNAINTVTVTYGQQVSYTIQPTDANGVNIGTATAAITGVSGAPIDTTQLPTVAGYTAPTFNDTDTDTTNNTPIISAAGGVIKVAYTANEQTFTVTQTGEPAGNTIGYTYTVNGGAAQTGAYGTAVTAHVGDAIAITPGAIANYDASVNNGAITLGASAAGSAAVTYSQTAQTFTVSQTGAPTGSTTGYTYTINGGTAQTGTYGTAVSAHAGDKIVVTPTAITNYNASINNNTITLAADKAGSAVVTYTQIAPTFTVTQTGAPTGSTTGFTYTVNGGTAQNGTYGTAVSAHAGDTIAITAGTITNYNSAINNGTLTLSATATGTATVTYTLATQTVAMALSQAVVANYDGTTTASGFLTTGVTKYSDATNATTGSLSWLAWNNTAISTYFAGAGASQKTAFVNDLAAMGTSANLSKYFTLANDGTTSAQYSYTLTQAGIDAINSALATTTGGLYQVSFASGAATSQVVIENQLSFVPISKVYDGTSVTSVAPQLTIEGKYYDTKNNVLTGYKTITGQTGVSDFTPISGDQNVGTYIEKLNADGVAWMNTTFASYIKGDVNGANFSYMTAEMTVTARAATVTPVITAVAKDGTPTVSLSFNVPAVTGAANIASGSSLAPSYKFSDLTKGSDYTLTDVNDLMTVTLSDAGLTKISQANPNYSFTSVAGTAATSTITFNYIDTQNGNKVVNTVTQTGLASDNSAQNYAVDLFGWPTGTEYQLGPTQVSSIPYTFGTSKSVAIYLTHYTATVNVTVTDTNGNTLTAPQTINLDPLDSDTSTADVAVNGYPTSQIKSITYTYVTGGRNGQDVTNVVATVNDTKTSVTAIQNNNDGTTDTVMPATNGNGGMLADMFGNGMLITFGSPVTITKSDQSDLLQYASIAVVYFAQATATVDFVDDDDKDEDGNSTALTDTQTISGFVDDPAQNTAITIPTGYALATTQDSNVTVTDGAAAYTGILTDDDSDNVVVHLVHATETIDPDNTSVGTADYNATHVTVNVNVVAGDNPTAVQITNGNESAVYTRSAIKDAVTGTYTYAANTNWKLAGPILGTPTVKAASGYAVTYTGEGTTNGMPGNGGQLMNITALDVPNALKTATPGETISLNYTVNAESTSQTIKVNYVDTTDGADTVVATDTTTGTQAETISYDATSKIPAGYTLANGQASTVTYAVTEQTDQVISVNLVHKTVTVTSDAPVAAGTVIVDGVPTGATYPDGVANDDLNGRVVRTISYSYAGDEPFNEIVQGVLFTRTATVDEVTGTLLGYSDWEVSTYPNAPMDYANGSFNGYETPTIKGYTPNIADVPALAVTSDVIAKYTDGSLDVSVVYTADPTITVDPTDPKNAGDPIDSNNPDGLNYPEGVDETSLNKSISRLITYTGVDSGNPASVSQTGYYTRTATIDEKTGELLSYGDWTLTTSDDGNDTNDGFTAVASPEVLGYTASGDAPATAPTNDEITKFVAHSADVSITYSQDATITIDPTNPQNPGTLIDQSNPDGPKYPDGVSDSELNKSVSRTITYSGAEPNDPTSVTQTGYYTRTATIDAKTGDFLSYGDWTLTTTDDDNNANDGFTAVTSPAVKGYTASSDVAAATLSNDEISSFVAGSDDVTIIYSQDATITIDPTDPKNAGDPIDSSNPDGAKYPEGVSDTDLNKQITRTITYTGAEPDDPASVKQTGNYTRTATIDAKNGDFLSYGDWTLTTSDDGDDTNDGFTAVTSPKVLGYTASGDVAAVTPTNDEINSFVAGSADVKITYSPNDTATVTTPINAGDPVSPDGPASNKTITDADLNKTVSREIDASFVGGTQDGDTKTLANQSTAYTRSAIFDSTTGEFLTFTDWTVAGTDGLTAYTPSAETDYTVTPTTVVAVSASDITTALSQSDATIALTQCKSFTLTLGQRRRTRMAARRPQRRMIMATLLASTRRGRMVIKHTLPLIRTRTLQQPQKHRTAKRH